MLIQDPPVELTSGVWMLGTTAFPVYVVRGAREGMIIEGGISAIGSILCRQLAELGIGQDFLRKAIITHAHPDHVMAIPQLRQTFPGISVVASAPAAAVLASEKAVAFFRQVDTLFTAAAAQSAAGPCASSEPVIAENCFAVDQVVQDGDTLAMEDSPWTVLATPGHSDCSISLYNAASRVLVISDASGYFLPAAQTWWPNYFTGYAAYMQSLERLAGLEADLLCLSHNGAVRGAAAIRSYFEDTLETTRQYHARIVAEAQAGKTVRQIAEMLGDEIHRQLQTMPLDFFQKNCGLLVKHSLRHEGINAA